MLKYNNISCPVYKENIVKALNSSWTTKSMEGRAMT
jgi:hypothetical protein